MKDIYVEGEFFLYPNGTIARIIQRHYPSGKVKLRCCKACVGVFSDYERIGKPYTYQRWSHIKNLEKAKRIGTEQILPMLFIFNEEMNKRGLQK